MTKGASLAFERRLSSQEAKAQHRDGQAEPLLRIRTALKEALILLLEKSGATQIYTVL